MIPFKDLPDPVNGLRCRALSEFNQRSALHESLVGLGIEGNLSDEVSVVLFGHFLDVAALLWVEVRFVDHHSSGNTEMVGEFQNPLEVVNSGHRGFGDDHHQIKACDRGYYRATYPRRPVAEDARSAVLFGQLRGPIPHHCDQFSGVLLSDTKAGMSHWTEAALGNEPGTVGAVLGGDRPDRTDM